MNIQKLGLSHLLAVNGQSRYGDADLQPSVRGVKYTQGHLGGDAHTTRTWEFELIRHNHYGLKKKKTLRQLIDDEQCQRSVCVRVSVRVCVHTYVIKLHQLVKSKYILQQDY